MQLFCQSVVSSYLLCLPSGLRPDYFGDCYSSGTTTTTTTTTPAAAVAGISLGALALRGASVAVVANNAPSAPRPGTTIVRSCRAQPPTSRHREQSSRRYGRPGLLEQPVFASVFVPLVRWLLVRDGPVRSLGLWRS